MSPRTVHVATYVSKTVEQKRLVMKHGTATTCILHLKVSHIKQK